MLPDQSIVQLLDRVLKYNELDITITEHGALHPSASTTGLMIFSPSARYFEVGRIDESQLDDYARRREMSPDVMRPYLAREL